MSESKQHVLSRVRPPRVHITYDVETLGSPQKKELPFIVGILADLSGKSEKPLPKLKDRKFVNIDLDTFDDVLEAIEPKVAFPVANKLQPGSNQSLQVALKFKEMEDFDPVRIVNQIAPLRKLFEARQRLNDLLAKLDGNDDLDSILGKVLASTAEQEKLRAELAAIEGPATSGGATAEPPAPPPETPA